MLAAVQAASSEIYRARAARMSLPSALPPNVGPDIFSALERVAPLRFVEESLAQADLDRGEFTGAQVHIERLRASAARSELEGRLLEARGEHAAAAGAFLAADDLDWLQGEVEKKAREGDLRGAYALENRIQQRLRQTQTHPDALADSDWRLGLLCASLAGHHPPANRVWMERALLNYQQAVALAPFSDKYLLAAATQASQLGQPALARTYLQRILEIDPGSAEAASSLQKLP